MRRPDGLTERIVPSLSATHSPSATLSVMACERLAIWPRSISVVRRPVTSLATPRHRRDQRSRRTARPSAEPDLPLVAARRRSLSLPPRPLRSSTTGMPCSYNGPLQRSHLPVSCRNVTTHRLDRKPGSCVGVQGTFDQRHDACEQLVAGAVTFGVVGSLESD